MAEDREALDRLERDPLYLTSMQVMRATMTKLQGETLEMLVAVAYRRGRIDGVNEFVAKFNADYPHPAHQEDRGE